MVLNSYYENDLGTYKSGKIEYQLTDLVGGEHTVSIKAWDNYNNSSTESLVFLVRTEEGFILDKLINYPNPFTTETRVNLQHNRPDTQVEIVIHIYSTGGQLIRTITEEQITPGYILIL